MDTEKALEILGISNEIGLTKRILKKAYNKAARQTHPDKNKKRKRESEEFIEVKLAYDTLLKLFEEEDVVLDFIPQNELDKLRFKEQIPQNEVRIDLESLFWGTQLDIPLEIKKKCSDCEALGGKVVLCPSGCSKNWKKWGHQNLLSVAMEETASKKGCGICNGHGIYVPQETQCQQCHGRGYTIKRLTYQFKIPKGAGDGQTFSVDIDEDQEAIFIIKELPHGDFRRDGANLHFRDIHVSRSDMESEEFKFDIPYFGNRTFHIRCGEKIRPNCREEPSTCVFVLRNKGMPHFDSHRHGDLYFHFKILFPVTIPNVPHKRDLPPDTYIIRSPKEVNEVPPSCHQQ